MTKEKFEEARKILPVQQLIDDREEILYHSFKFVRDGNKYDILDLTKGDYQISVINDSDKTDLFNNLPFVYVCDLYYVQSQAKKLLNIELKSLEYDLSDRESEEKKSIRNRLRFGLKSF